MLDDSDEKALESVAPPRGVRGRFRRVRGELSKRFGPALKVAASAIARDGDHARQLDGLVDNVIDPDSKKASVSKASRHMAAVEASANRLGVFVEVLKSAGTITPRPLSVIMLVKILEMAWTDSRKGVDELRAAAGLLGPDWSTWTEERPAGKLLSLSGWIQSLKDEQETSTKVGDTTVATAATVELVNSSIQRVCAVRNDLRESLDQWRRIK